MHPLCACSPRRPPLPPRNNPHRPPRSVGTFYEGVIAQGYTSDAVDDALQRNVVGAGYGVAAT